VRAKLKDLVDKSSSEGIYCPLGHEKQLYRLLPEQSSDWSNLHKEKPLTIGQISEENYKGANKCKERVRYAVLSNIKIPVEE